MKLCVIGTGYVGLVSAACFAEIGHEVVGVDIDAAKVERLKKGECPIYEPGLPELLNKHLKAGRITFTTNLDEGIHACSLIMAAVGTPTGQGRRADLSQVESVCRTIGMHTNEEKVLVIKSTVPVGTSQKCQVWVEEEMSKRGVQHHVHLVSNPEFLREGKAVQDFLEPDRIIVGHRDESAGKAMRELYKPLIDRGMKYLEMDVESAELTKYASNAFLATKISFINFIAALCEASGADVEKVAEGMGLDKRIAPAFLKAGIGYGGSCFPKDVQALIKTADELGVPSELLRNVEAINEAQRDRFVRMVEKALGGVRGKKLAVWGLAFKPDTDDMRSAPSIDIVSALLERGAEIVAYDPVSMDVAKSMLPKLTFAPNGSQALAGADALLILTDWEEFRAWKPEAFKEKLRGGYIFDGRNMYDPRTMKEGGIRYHSIGRM
ncbi:MAG TPA: UDP-glucose/GDP-mannose dehydrogenase family protein [Candidatus Peribacterales bacterium]|nr:UDP-glucose/GDP-mannose dehydrogenase family protein [Candidatus Peribacterales bacterium]